MRGMASPTPPALLGGLSPQQFMRRHWQRKPLLVRQAWPGVKPPLTRAALFALAGRDDVESRLVTHVGEQWTLRRGPMPRRALPPLAQPRWTLLVQGVDLHDETAHAMLAPFRFVADARFDDLMVSYATDGGGVGAHVDAYDVFLLQVHGRRRWRVGAVRDRRFVEGAPLKLLRRFEPTEEWLLEPGDMLYLPPMWGHDGIAVGECMTASIGFRAPTQAAVLRELMERVGESLDESAHDVWYRDAGAAAVGATPARIPSGLQQFARTACRQLLRDPRPLQHALGQWLTEPKAEVWFEAGRPDPSRGCGAVRLDRRSRMMYDAQRLYLNGECVAVAPADARILRMLADHHRLSASDARRLGRAGRALINQWLTHGWLRGD